MPLNSEIRIALATDVHYADADPKGTRHYRESLGKMEEMASVLGPRRPHLAVHLGDLVDAEASTSHRVAQGYLRAIDEVFSRVARRRVYVLGNHCVAAGTKQDFLRTVQQSRSFFSRDIGGWHLVVLDACYRSDGAGYEPGKFVWTDSDIPPAQREWLAADLKKTSLPTVVFCHQRLDLRPSSPFVVRSAGEVRRIFEESGKVKAVFMGHSHKNDLKTIRGVPYATLAAMVEGCGAGNSGYSLLTLLPDGGFKLEGFRWHAWHPLAVR